MIDLAEELATALSSPKVRQALADLVRDALRGELSPSGANGENLVDAEEAAKILGMTLAAVRKAATRGTLPCHRLGRRIRFRPAELLAFVTGESPR
jgi:excisionase family DNA binding protein